MDLMAALSRGGGKSMSYDELVSAYAGEAPKEDIGVQKMEEEPIPPPPELITRPKAAGGNEAVCPSFGFNDPADGARVVFSTLGTGAQGAYYSVDNIARPLFKTAFFGKDATGYYIELTDIRRQVALPSSVAPDAVRRLKLIFETANVAHNLHPPQKQETPVPPTPANPPPPTEPPPPIESAPLPAVKETEVEPRKDKREPKKTDPEPKTKENSKAMQKARAFEEMFWNGATVGGNSGNAGGKGGKTGGKQGSKGPQKSAKIRVKRADGS